MEAKRLGKACVYDLPTCYYPAWEKIQAELGRKYSEWIPSNGSPPAHDMRLEQKRKEMELADLTLVASRYVEATVLEFYPHKEIARTPYGVDAEFWSPGPTSKPLGAASFYICWERLGAERHSVADRGLVKGCVARRRAQPRRFLGTFRGQKAIFASPASNGFLPALRRSCAICIASPTYLCSHHILTDLVWLCSKLWHVVCLRSLPKLALVRNHNKRMWIYHSRQETWIG